jgi:hypothetical protein
MVLGAVAKAREALSDDRHDAKMPAKEQAMIELTDDQLQAIDHETQPAAVVDRRKGQVYRLIKEEVYQTVCGIIKPFNRGWDPDEDLIRKDA